MTNIISSEILQKFISYSPELEFHINNNRASLILEPNRQPPFEYLIRAIIHQQLSGKAASTIHGRFLDLIGQLSPKNVLSLEEEDLKGAGLSRQKAGYVKNVARAFEGNLSKINSAQRLENLSDESIIQQFTTIKGVGTWTVEMYLIFGLGRLDIFSANDLGVRKGVQILYEIPKLPTPIQAKKITAHWTPYRTVGTILCWRILD